MHEIFNYTLAEFNDTSVKLHRQWINATASGSFRTADLIVNAVDGAHFYVTPGNNGSYTPPRVDIIVDEGGGTVQMLFVTNETTVLGLAPKTLFLSPENTSNPGVMTAIQGLANGSSVDAQQVTIIIRDQSLCQVLILIQ